MPSRSGDAGWRLTRSRASGLSESQVRQGDLRRRSFLTAGVAASPDPTSTSVVSNNIRRYLDVRMTNSVALLTASHSHVDQQRHGGEGIPVAAFDGCLPQHVATTIINPSSENRQRNAPRWPKLAS